MGALSTCRRGERPVSALGASRGRVSNDLETLPVNVVPAAGRVYPRIGLSDRCGWRRRGGAPVARDSVAAGGYSGNRARDAEARTGGEVQVARAEIPIPGGAGGGRILRSRYVYTASSATIYTCGGLSPLDHAHTRAWPDRSQPSRNQVRVLSQGLAVYVYVHTTPVPRTGSTAL